MIDPKNANALVSTIPNAIQQIYPQLNQEQAVNVGKWLEAEISNHLIQGYQLAFIKADFVVPPTIGSPLPSVDAFELNVLNINIDPNKLTLGM